MQHFLTVNWTPTGCCWPSVLDWICNPHTAQAPSRHQLINMRHGWNDQGSSGHPASPSGWFQIQSVPPLIFGMGKHVANHLLVCPRLELTLTTKRKYQHAEYFVPSFRIKGWFWLIFGRLLVQRGDSFCFLLAERQGKPVHPALLAEVEVKYFAQGHFC